MVSIILRQIDMLAVQSMKPLALFISRKHIISRMKALIQLNELDIDYGDQSGDCEKLHKTLDRNEKFN